MEIEIRENRLPKESAGYQNVIIHTLKFINARMNGNKTGIPEDGNIFVYIKSISEVRFVFENISMSLEIKFRVALHEFYRL